ncbi:hypothetical protein Gotur_005727 [Gossypium turneri]
MESGLHIATPILNVAKTDNIQNMETALDVSTPIRDVMTPLRVPIEQLDRTMNPPKKLLGDDVFKQFILLQKKQMEKMRNRGFQEYDE